jgi:hypothetical protein
MGESGERGEGQGRVTLSQTIGAIQVTPRAGGVELYFPPLRAAGSALMLALFGIACSVIGLAAISGLVRSGESAAASLVALAFAGVFALPLFLLGQLFIATALWSAANSLEVEVSAAGIITVRRWFGYAVARHALAREEIAAIDSRPAAKYIGAFGGARYYCLIARGGAPPRRILIADSLQGPAMTDELRHIIIEHLAMPALATAGELAHAPAGEPA